MTSQRPAWVPPDVDIDKPSAARVYDFFLGGAHNFAADRELARQIAGMTPDVGDTMRANREFLRRAVRYLVHAGIRQFLDIGSGIPTVGNVHEIAQQMMPGARVVYVDIDPVAVAHSRAILAGNPHTAVLQADARDAGAILAEPQLRAMIDLAKPVAVLLAGILHFIPDADDPPALVRRYLDAIAPGSFIVISNATSEGQPPEVIEAQKLSARTGTEVVLRSRAQLLEQFTGLSLVEPGLVSLPFWHPDAPGDAPEDPGRITGLGGVGRKEG